MELLDLYTKDREKLGRTMVRGEKQPEGTYHLVVHICIFNKKGEMLIQQRQSCKTYWPDLWDISVGGCATTGDNSWQAAERELREELGIEWSFEHTRPVMSINFDHGFDDFYVLESEIDPASLTLQPEEVQAVKWAGLEEILQLIDQKKFLPYHKSVIELLFFTRNHWGSHVSPDETVRATVLVDNLTREPLLSEWGLAFWITYQGHAILLDCGASSVFAENARMLGIDLKQAECGVLSHAHYDHADGMATFFELNEKAPFYLRQGAGENCYSKKEGKIRYIGIQKGILKKYRNRIRYAKEDQEILPGVFLIPHKTPGLEQIGRKIGMYTKGKIFRQYDSFAHEQSLVFDTENGLVIFNSCSHGGVDHIIREVEETFRGKEIAAYIGGFHLYRSSEEEVRAFAKRVKETGIQKLYTGHCTGQEAYDILKEELGDKIQQLYTGLELIL